MGARTRSPTLVPLFVPRQNAQLDCTSPMARTRIAAALILCLIGAALSLLLLSKHYGVPLFGEAVLAACGQGEGCDIVSQSRYAMFLGLPLAAWGLFHYGSLLALLTPALFGQDDENATAAPAV